MGYSMFCFLSFGGIVLVQRAILSDVGWCKNRIQVLHTKGEGPLSYISEPLSTSLKLLFKKVDGPLGPSDLRYSGGGKTK